MFRGFDTLSSRLKAFSPILRSYCANFAKFDTGKTKLSLKEFQPLVLSTRNSSHGQKTMVVRSSIFMNEKYYDDLHFFIMLGLVPCVLGAFIINIVVGQAELVETPEDYEPRYWEYYKHPITRFIVRNFMWSPQQIYENHLAYIKRHMDSQEILKEEKWFQQSELKNLDYRGWQYIPVNPAGVLRAHEEQLINEEMGDCVPR
ncbi:unnamed protein product [Rodentolepis nana]|uniref:NADH dehydrogenase [ubiquinone] 1 beta subcomplex subunit 5, mitochondrial n=1 Tax=Rodentolepis nana TaxID=102285 RepID=A0A0R3T172_RODNA|nr:unnamed protein product [Rodentolepis nana]